MKKPKYYLTTAPYMDGVIPVEWGKLGDEIIDSIPGKYLFNVLSSNLEGDIIEKTFIYLDPTSKFSKDTVKIDMGDIVIGYDLL